jgi:hypothetical protein
MTDRELLELAAKAAGIAVVRSRLDDPMNSDFLVVGSVRNHEQRNGPWNPLADDGDALRLAVKLKKFPHLLHDGDGVITGYEAKRNSFSPIIEQFGDDPDAATRRAIVRAAAEIGKAMP